MKKKQILQNSRISGEQAIEIINFWQKTVTKDRLFERSVVAKIDQKGSEITDLVGVRRSGKSSVLKLLIENFGLHEQSLYLNFEDPFFIEHNSPQIIEQLIEIYKEHFNADLKYLFFDEIQAIDKWERAIRKLREAGEYKIYITGSSSKLLSGELATLITGRHLSYKVFPLSFREFVNFKGISVATKKEQTLAKIKIEKAFAEYVKIGGFPEIVKTKNMALLKTYFHDILQKDIISRYDIREKNALEKMALFVLSNAGKSISIESLKNTFGLSYETANNYLEYFKEAFLIFELSQFSYSLKTQQKSFKKIYSIDQGLSNAVSFRFSEDKGRILENIVMAELMKRECEVYYYKTANNLEVDFYLPGQKKLIQACFSLADDKTRKRELKSLLTAMKEAKIKEGIILTQHEEDELKMEGKVIKIMPVWKWLLDVK